MKKFIVVVRTEGRRTVYAALAPSSFAAFMEAAEAQGETPCAISVVLA